MRFERLPLFLLVVGIGLLATAAPDVGSSGDDTAEIALAKRVPRRIIEQETPPYALDEQGRVLLAVRFENQVSLDRAQQLVRDRGGEVLGQNRFERFQILEIAIERESITALALNAPVVTVDLPLPRKQVAGWNANYEANIVDLWDPPYDLSGEGYTIGMWDGGDPDINHPELLGRVILADGDGGDAGHSTHIAGVLIAEGLSPSEPLLPRAPSYKAQLVAWDFLDAINEIFDASFTTIVSANNSWGVRVGWWWDPFPSGILGPGWRNERNEELFGAYILETALLDDIVYQADLANKTYMINFPSGDDRVEGIGVPGTQHDGTYYPNYPHALPYFNCINPISSGKNVITVGATGNVLDVTNFSCWGPTLDGRVKPDLVARGQAVYSTAASTMNYTNQSGTSQAAAVITSASVLVMEQYKRNFGQDPGTAEVKALMINSANDLGPAGPDPLFGFGLIDIGKSVDTIVEDAGTHAFFKADSIGHGEEFAYDMFVPAGTESVTVTLTWIDPAGSTTVTNAIVNNLDLRLVTPGAQDRYPFRLSAIDPTLLAANDAPNQVDTVEQVVVDNPTPGLWSVRVAGTSVPVNSPQKFALVSDTALHAGAPEPTNVVFEVNADGSSVDISWDAVVDPEIAEFRIFRTAAPGEELELIATVPGGTFNYTDAPPALAAVGYDVRSVYDRNGARVISERPFGLQTPNPVLFAPIRDAVLPNGGTTTRIIGKTKLVATVELYEGASTVPFATVIADGDGIFHVDHDFGGTGSFSIRAQSDWFHEGISIPSLEVDFQIVP